ncbi:hypothetical protein, partial [Escherichia sp. TW09276]|uniref:hypothetical protein n=1 Tax=Escherichia sp. TW09276 TaxID=754330 RepID=UPI001ED91354
NDLLIRTFLKSLPTKMSQDAFLSQKSVLFSNHQKHCLIHSTSTAPQFSGSNATGQMVRLS